MSKHVKYWLFGLVFLAVIIRFHGLFANTFFADEALFASWARQIATLRDPLLMGEIVDKPPLLFYLQAIFFPLFGPVEWAARLPNFIASILLIPLTGQLAWRLFQDELQTVLTAGFITFSPLAIQFSATAFTDPLLTALLIASLYFAVRVGFGHVGSGDSRGGLLSDPAFISGILFGLAAATKYQAWLFLPLIFGLGYLFDWKKTQFRFWLMGFLPILVLILLWDISRTGQFSLLNEQLSAYGGLRVIWSWELWPRFAAWGEQWDFLFYSPVLGFFFLLALPPFIALMIHDQDRSSAVDQLLVAFIIVYFVIHWFLAVPVWDRYVLPIAPLVGMILARFIARVIAFFKPAIPPDLIDGKLLERLFWLVPILLLLIQTPAIVEARQGNLPVGGRPEADHGAGRIAEVLSDAPYGTVLYDHWFSWQWRYHLFDSGVYVSWFESPAALVDDLNVFGREGGLKYIVLPDALPALPVIRAIEGAGFDLNPIKCAIDRDGESTMILYQLEGERTQR